MIISYKKAQKMIKGFKRKKVGVITGGFDVVHHGHISLFKFASESVDVVFVGLDQDKTLNNSKTEKRPIFKYSLRAKVVDSIKFVDYVFKIPVTYSLDYKDYEVYKKMIKGLGVNYLISCSSADALLDGKKRLCKELGIILLNDKRKRVTSSTIIIDRLKL